jgi:hypothetical protein
VTRWPEDFEPQRYGAVREWMTMAKRTNRVALGAGEVSASSFRCVAALTCRRDGE